MNEPNPPSSAEHLAAPGSHVSVLDRVADEVMTAGVLVVPVTAPLEEAARAMAAHHVHGVLAVSSEGRPCGWVTSEEVMRHLGDSHLVDWALDAIGEKFLTVGRSTPVREVMAMLARSGVSRVAVQEPHETMPQGVITDLDIAKLMEKDAGP